MKYVILALAFFLVTQWEGRLLAGVLPKCPSKSFQTEVVSPIDSSKRVLCSKKTPNGYVKHGPEWIYDLKGQVVLKNTYENGELVSSLEVQQEVQKQEIQEETPKEQDKKDDKNVSLKDDYSFVRAVLHEILQLWHPVKRPSQGRLALGGFETRSCDVNDFLLSRFYKGKAESFKLDLEFSQRCSVLGVDELKWERPMRINWKLRDMRDYESLDMQLTLYKRTRKEGEKKLYRIQTQIRDATLRTETGGLTFEADYIMSVDTDERKALKGHGGELKMKKFNAKKIQENLPLLLKIHELP